MSILRFVVVVVCVSVSSSRAREPGPSPAKTKVELAVGDARKPLSADGTQEGRGSKESFRMGRSDLETADPESTTDGKQGLGRPTFWAFFKLGVEHIWMGYDHLLFLFALLVTCRSVRSVLIVISCFTVAHSITLACATLDWVRVPPRITEILIAGSIVLVGLENLWRHGEEPRGRWLITLAFGLLHGLGFANVLRDLGVGRQDGGGVAMPLFSFNLGVEIGQIAIAAVVLPIYWWLAKDEMVARRARLVVSLATVLLGLFWMMERILET